MRPACYGRGLIFNKGSLVGVDVGYGLFCEHTCGIEGIQILAARSNRVFRDFSSKSEYKENTKLLKKDIKVLNKYKSSFFL